MSSELSTPEERTEMPTDRRISRLRVEGMLHLSQEVTQCVALFAGFTLLSFMWSYIYGDMKQVLIKAFSTITVSRDLDIQAFERVISELIWLSGPKVLLLCLVVGGFAGLTVMLQTNWNVREKKIKFTWTFLNPIAGLKRIISIAGVVSTLKSLLKLAIILPIGYMALKKFAPAMIRLCHFSVEQILDFGGNGITYIFWKIFYILIAFAIFDWFWSKHLWLKANKMTKSEVKDERKAVEGDEASRRRIIAKGMERAWRRIAASVPKADVVITNPTHLSVALKYDRDKMSAPVVVAKGKGHLALRIREIARDAGVPVLERKPLARALFESTEIGSVIPRELFKAVAEVLAYVYKLKNPYAYQNSARR